MVGFRTKMQAEQFLVQCRNGWPGSVSHLNVYNTFKHSDQGASLRLLKQELASLAVSKAIV